MLIRFVMNESSVLDANIYYLHNRNTVIAAGLYEEFIYHELKEQSFEERFKEAVNIWRKPYLRDYFRLKRFTKNKLDKNRCGELKNS